MPDTSWLDDEITVTNTGTTERRDTDEEFSTIDVLDLKTVKLGRQGENNTQQVVIDCSEWLTDLPGCQLMVMALRPGEKELYMPQVTASNGVITWPILSQDTALAEDVPPESETETETETESEVKLPETDPVLLAQNADVLAEVLAYIMEAEQTAP